ncbi:MAG: malto-oligosyltrehalose synthase [candidate division Zixibacteria bacterium]|nr:malto-oligosyltrehalose synthase [candidate division Zixibacteria bacterium]
MVIPFQGNRFQVTNGSQGMKIPRATYRIQFTPSFDFKTSESIVSYLSGLGISHIYASPVFKACSGSEHGYDVVDPTRINEELGGFEGLKSLNSKAGDEGIGWVQDIVPNHMAVDRENSWLMDVLEHGPGSKYYNFFDIKWDHYYQSTRGRMLLPFLGGFYGETVEKGEISIIYAEKGFMVRYYDIFLPLKLETYEDILNCDIEGLKDKMGRDNPDYISFIGITQTLCNLPPIANIDQRYRQISFGKRKLWELYERNDDIKAYIEKCLSAVNGNPEDPITYNKLDKILAEQYFRLSFWKVADVEINYRRFFTINNLISTRVENEDVFRHIHQMVKKLIDENILNGIRVDHIDGLYDPEGYINRIRDLAPDTYMVIEKILESDETLPEDWKVEGTTGYDSLNFINGLFCMRKNKTAFKTLYSRFTGQSKDYRDLVAEKKRLIANQHLAGDVDNLAHSLKRISSDNRHGNDIALGNLRRALVEIMSWFPVYRTYIQSDKIDSIDRKHILNAVDRALAHTPDLAYELEFVRDFLLLEFSMLRDKSRETEALEFIKRFQQLTGPLMAKGFEDTTLYIYNPLVSLNEVGGDPDSFGIPTDQFHNFCQEKYKRHPHSMNTLTTHDTKRSEDMRARINVLSEMPERWSSKLKEWAKINRGYRVKSKNKFMPTRNDEYLFYQTLIGTMPFDRADLAGYRDRIKEYCVKAVREAKVHTAWLKPDDSYEWAFQNFVDKVLRQESDNAFLENFYSFQEEIAYYGIFNSLSQTLIKFTMPGVPDTYQGSELWDFRMVDPDNRRPVDFDYREKLLNGIKNKENEKLPSLLEQFNQNPGDSRIKLFLIHRTLQFRNNSAELFNMGEYIPLEIEGEKSENLVAFARKHKNQWSLTIAPRFLTTLIAKDNMPCGNDIWKDTTIILPENSPGRWENIFTTDIIEASGAITAGSVISKFPVTLLKGQTDA